MATRQCAALVLSQVSCTPAYLPRSFIILCMILVLAHPLDAQWVQTHGPEGGSPSAFARLDECLFAGMLGGGVFLSTDQGNHWTCSNAGLSNLNVNVIAANDTEVFVGTYGGIFLSTDHGALWSLADSALSTTIVTHLLFYGGKGYATTSGRGVLRSTDNGRSWQPINSNIRTYSPGSLAAREDRIFVSANGVYISTNEGENWQRDGTGLPFLNADNFSVIGGRIYAGALWGRVCYTTNNGDFWINLLNDFDSAGVTGICHIGSQLLASTQGEGVFASGDSGLTWRRVNGGLTNRYVNCLYVDSSIAYAGTSGSLFRSKDNGESWAPSNAGITSTTITSLAQSSHYLFTGTTSSGMFRTSNAGERWMPCNSGLGNEEVLATAVLGPNIFVGTAEGSIFRSVNEGVNWIPAGQGLPGDQITTLAVVRDKVFAGTSTHGVFRSTNKGSLWFPVNEGLAHTCFSASSICINALASMEDTLYAGAPYGVFRSTDFGLNWSHSDSGLNQSGASSFAVRNGDLFAVNASGLFLSTNGGRAWSQVNTPGPGVTGLVARGSSLAAISRNEGIFISSNSGQSWNPMNEGLTDKSLRCVCIADSTVFVGTGNTGVWRRPFSELVVSVEEENPPISIRSVFAQNYPNPFNPSTTIHYGLPHASFVTLTVYNALGQQVAQLVNGQQQAGYHDVVFRGDKLASGVYFFRLRAGDFVASRKLLLLK